MKQILLAGLISLGLVSSAQAGMIVTNGSTYGIWLFTDSATNLFSTATFDGGDEVKNLNSGLEVTVSESQTDLGGGKFQIDISFVGNGELFPGMSGDTALVNIGAYTNPLDLASPVELTSAINTFRYQDGTISDSFDFLPLVVNPNPWDGYFIALGGAGGFIGSAGIGITQVDLSFTVMRTVPEPSTFALLGIGGIALIGYARRRKQQAA